MKYWPREFGIGALLAALGLCIGIALFWFFCVPGCKGTDAGDWNGLRGCGEGPCQTFGDPDQEWFHEPHYFVWDGNAWKPVASNSKALNDARECE